MRLVSSDQFGLFCSASTSVVSEFEFKRFSKILVEVNWVLSHWRKSTRKEYGENISLTLLRRLYPCTNMYWESKGWKTANIELKTALNCLRAAGCTTFRYFGREICNVLHSKFLLRELLRFHFHF